MLKTRVVGEELSPPGTGCTLNIKLLLSQYFLFILGSGPVRLLVYWSLCCISLGVSVCTPQER